MTQARTAPIADPCAQLVALSAGAESVDHARHQWWLGLGEAEAAEL
jgi:hypothetical protein